MGEIGQIKRRSRTVCEFEWRIPEFASFPTEENLYFSPEFEVLGKMCYLEIHFNGLKSTLDHFDIGLCVHKYSQETSTVMKVSFAIRDADGNKVHERHDPYQLLSLFYYGVDFYISRAELLERASELLPSNILTVVCSVGYPESMDGKSKSQMSKCKHCTHIVDAKAISFHEKNCSVKPVTCPECSENVVLWHWSQHVCELKKKTGETLKQVSPVVLHENKLMLDFKELFLKKENCDVIIKVRGEEFQAHKLILETRSPVLASTFRFDMKEKATGLVEIEDCDPSCFSDFLCFLYCGDMEVISQKNVFCLFFASDKYDVQDLKARCLMFVKKNLSVDTFCDTITLALRHCETDLIKLTSDFFTKNAPDIILTVKWQIFLAENPTKSNDLFVKLLKPYASLNK